MKQTLPFLRCHLSKGIECMPGSAILYLVVCARVLYNIENKFEEHMQMCFGHSPSRKQIKVPRSLLVS